MIDLLSMKAYKCSKCGHNKWNIFTDNNQDGIMQALAFSCNNCPAVDYVSFPYLDLCPKSDRHGPG